MGKAVRISMLVVFLGLVIMVLVVYKLYSRVFVPNVVLDSAHELFYIPTGSAYEDVIDEVGEITFTPNDEEANYKELKRVDDKLKQIRRDK